MFIPYNTDAPIYHWPIATVGLITANVFAFFAMMAALESAEDAEVVMPYVLQLGQGIRPLQWITANFLHIDLIHLAGNMFGLWTFGLLVEGKLGWWRFLGIYLGVGVVVLAITQIVSLGMAPNIGLGASGIIYGLVGMALIWAPENEVSCFMLLIFRPIIFEIRIWTFAVIYVIIQVVIVALVGLTIGSEAVHLLGLVLGAAVGVVMLRKDWVDCENWDVFSVWTGRHTMSREEREELELREAPAPEPDASPEQREAALRQIRDILAEGGVELALAAHRKMAARFPDWRLAEPDLLRLIQGCLQGGRRADAVPLMVEYLRAYSGRAVPVRLALAQVLLVPQQRPAQARRVLAKLRGAKLTARQLQQRRSLEKRAAAMIEEGALELETEDW